METHGIDDLLLLVPDLLLKRLKYDVLICN
jgi:hypothetical protein